MKLKIQTRMVYGRILHYPMCETSHFIAKLGKRPRDGYALSDSALKELIKLGFRIVQVPQFQQTSFPPLEKNSQSKIVAE